MLSVSSSGLNTSYPAIFIRRVGRKHVQCITLRGQWVSFDIKFAHSRMISRFVDPALLAPVLPYLPSASEDEEFSGKRAEMDLDIPREISAPIVHALKEFWEGTQAIYRKHASVLDKAHDILAHEKDLRFGSLERITRKLLNIEDGPLGAATLYAVRRALVADTSGFNFDTRSHGKTQMFHIRSKEQTEGLRLVRQWIRDYQEIETAEKSDRSSTKQQHEGWNIIRDFVEKSRKLIQDSRRYRPSYQYGSIGPSTQKPGNSRSNALGFRPHGQFDDNDRLIIRFLEAWSVHTSFSRDVGFAALPPILLRATDMYDELETFGPSLGYIFLQEIGVLEPYANRTLYDANLLLPSSQHSRPLEQLASSLKNVRRSSLKLSDSMADLRHHWENLNVFCIDDKGTSEVDDGISVERIPGFSTEHWLHIHVANPTAFIERDSIFARMAAHLTETFYSPEKVYYLLPHWMSVDHFSLKSNRPCLTFSARLDDQGNLVEAKVQSAVIHKVQHLSYDEANKLIGLDDDRSEETLSIGSQMESKQETPLPKLSKDELDDLKLLQKLAMNRVKFRVARGSLHINKWEPRTQVFDKLGVYGLPDTYPHRATGVKVIGDPRMTMTVRPVYNWFGDFASSISDAIVRESMLLACETAAKWSSERNIPVVYRGTADDFSRDERIKFEQEVLQPAMDANGGVPPMWAGLQYIRFNAVGAVGPTPLKHTVLGLDQYTKATSPLRRYGDMLTHWQIEAALRIEAQTGQSLVGQTHHLKKLPFGEEQIAGIVSRLRPREWLIAKHSDLSERFWRTMFMMRSHFYDQLPREQQKWKFNVLITNINILNRKSDDWAMGLHMDWGLLIHISETHDAWRAGAEGALPGGGVGSGEGWLPEVGDVWECEMTTCNLYHRTVTGRLTKLISRRAI